MAGKFEVLRSKNGKQYFNLKSGNGQVILTSEMYEQASGCKNGIESVRKNCADRACFAINEQKDGKPYFCLKARNGEVIGRSQAYKSASSMNKGIASVQKNGPTARVVDNSGS